MKKSTSSTETNISRRALLHGMGATIGGGIAARLSGGPLPAARAQTSANNGESNMKEILRIPTWYYQHFDADYDLDVPEEAFGGWKKADLEFSRKHTAVVSMHAWDTGTFQEFPGWWRIVPYIPRANAVLRDVFPGLFAAVRESGLPLFHVVGGGDYYKDCPGYKHAAELAGPSPEPPEKVDLDETRKRLAEFRREHVFQGLHNEEDVKRGFARVDFPKEARPRDDEGVAEDARQLFALCKEREINHLIYCGFAINWCLLLSPGGMADMQKHGVLCSALRQATVAVENKETAREQLEKETALWRVALSFGYVFDVDDFVTSL